MRPPAYDFADVVIGSPACGSIPLDMNAPDSRLWSTPKFFAIALAIEFVTMFVLNGLLNMILEWNVPSAALGVGGSVLLVFLFPRWRWFAELHKRAPTG